MRKGRNFTTENTNEGELENVQENSGLVESPEAEGKPESRSRRSATPVRAYRVVIADGQSMVRRGLRSLLEPQYGLEIIGEAETGLQAVEMAKSEKPDLVILDLEMAELDGLAVTRAIREEVPETQVLVLTMHLSDDLAREVLRAGALGYVLKSDTERDLLVAVEQMKRRRPFFTTELALAMARNFVTGAPGSGRRNGSGNDSELTDREVGVLQMLAEGRSNKQVAAELHVSVRTVESHRNRIMHKMNFTTFSELVRFAVRNSLVQP